MKHVYNWNQNKSYLDQPSKGDAFRQNGVHYVRWGDVLFNFAARPVLGWKTFVIVVITVLLTLNGKYDTVKFIRINEGIEKETLALLTIGMTYLIGVRISLSYDRYYEARPVEVSRNT